VLSKSYLWGLDLSGTLQGAGGVGGLLCCSLTTNNSTTDNLLPSFDGNGNIVAWTVSGATAPSCLREYDAFGNVVVEQGTPPCGFGFSTKIEDPESGLVYYGYRYYDPLTGRWPSRDPIEANWATGEFNEYAFVRNSGVGDFDILGRESADQKRARAAERNADNVNNRLNNQNRINTSNVRGNNPAADNEAASLPGSIAASVAELAKWTHDEMERYMLVGDYQEGLDMCEKQVSTWGPNKRLGDCCCCVISVLYLIDPATGDYMSAPGIPPRGTVVAKPCDQTEADHSRFGGADITYQPPVSRIRQWVRVLFGLDPVPPPPMQTRTYRYRPWRCKS